MSRQETLENWAHGMYQKKTAEETQTQNAYALGGLDLLDQIISNIEEAQKEGEK